MANSTLDISEARRRFNKLDQELVEKRVIFITRHNKRAFAIVDPEYLETVLETIDVLADPEAAAALKASIEDIREGRIYDQDEVEEELL